MNAGLKILLPFLLSFQFTGMPVFADEGPERDFLERNTVFINSSRKVLMDVNFVIAGMPEVFYGQLLNICSNRNLLYSFILEYDAARGCDILLVSSKGVKKRKLTGFRIPVQADSIRFRVVIDHRQQSASVVYHDTAICFHDIAIDKVSRYEVSSFPDNARVSSATIRIQELESSPEGRRETLWLIFIIAADIGVFVFIHYRNKKRRSAEKEQQQKKELVLKYLPDNRPQRSCKSVIRLFGGFRVYDKKGEEISKKFSPLMKELTLLLICHSGRGGISSGKLKEFLWYDKSEQSARNNRAVYFAKLRMLLERVGEAEIATEGDRWFLSLPGIAVDYLEFHQILKKDKIAKEDIHALLLTLDNGALLNGYEFEWLDDIKSSASDAALMLLSNYILGLDIKEEPGLILRIADTLFLFDSLNEIALFYKCKVYKENGKHVLARQLYTSFIKEYKTLYGEEYKKSFSEIMVESPG